MMRSLIAVAAAGLLTACATLAPDALRIETAHESHLLEHAPFTNTPTSHGLDRASLIMRWYRGPVTLEVGEGYSFHGMDGCLDCPREIFEGRLAYEIPLHH